MSVDPKESNDSADKLKNATTKAREDEQMAKQIKSKLKNVPGGQKWSVYVRDLKSDRMASINADDEIVAPGVSNMFLLAPLENKISNNWNGKLGKFTTTKCVQNMIATSDADCGKAVAQRADIKNADSVNAGLGFKKTDLGGKEQKTTARELGDLLFRLQNGQVLSDKGRRAVFDGLYAQKSREGIAAGCDEKCLIGNIVGEGKDARHDAAIVTTGDAKYVVVIMTQGADWGKIADVASSIRTIFQP